MKNRIEFISNIKIEDSIKIEEIIDITYTEEQEELMWAEAILKRETELECNTICI